MKNINKYFKLYEAKAAADRALDEMLPKSNKHNWLALGSSAGKDIRLGVYEGFDGKPAVFHIQANSTFVFKEDGNNIFAPPTEAMLNELVKWLDEE